MLNFGHNVPSRGRFYKLANPVDARVKKFRQRAFFDCIPRASGAGQTKRLQRPLAKFFDPSIYWQGLGKHLVDNALLAF